ncbi:uncharacterized protein METZ01_LOCUS483838 [marine metagenome]|uniref:(S)-ureidoglycine aminohydrolase cupin domain-containing protein n=1 Tax=marine metagenome TaxID=408172 RepID=A0A383CFR9_9ZZZZ
MKISIHKPSEKEIDNKGIRSWPIWTCEASEFDWEYDQLESCLLLDGEVEVISDNELVKFGVGDFVVFPKGLKCRWKVIRPVRKHYSFG